LTSDLITNSFKISIINGEHATSKVLESQEVISVRTCVVSHHPSPRSQRSGLSLRHRPCGSASLPNRPRRWPLWSGLASKRWVVSRAVLGRCRELHHVFAFLRFVEFQRQRHDYGTASLGGMDRSRFTAATVRELWQSFSRQCRILPEQPKQSQIWSHLPPERRYPEQFPLIFIVSKGSEGSRRTCALPD
jgi:hypothetical protein